MSALRRRAFAPVVEAPTEAESAPKTKRTTKKKAAEPVPETPAAPVATAAAVATPAVAGRGLKSRAVDPAAIAAAFANQAASMGGAKTPFVKLTSGKNRLRLLPSENADRLSPFLYVVYHKAKVGGRFWQALDLEWLFGNEELAKAAIAAGKLTQADYASVQAYGDPWNVAAGRLKDAQLKEPYLWPARRFLWNVVNRVDGKLYVWESSKDAFEAVKTNVEAYAAEGVDIFDEDTGYDVLIEGNGLDGFQRRYGAPTVAPRPTPANVPEDGELIDLHDVVLRKVQPFARKVGSLFAAYGDTLTRLGLTPAQFGMSNLSVVSAETAETDEEDTEE